MLSLLLLGYYLLCDGELADMQYSPTDDYEKPRIMGVWIYLFLKLLMYALFVDNLPVIIRQ